MQEQLSPQAIELARMLAPEGVGVELATLPTANDLHVSQLLTNVSIAYRNEEYIWREVLPVVPVTRKKDSIREYDRADWNRSRAGVRSQNARGSRGGYNVTTQTFEAVERSMSTDVTDDERSMRSAVDDPDVSAAQFCSDQVNLAAEIVAAGVVFNAANYTSTTTLSGTSQWSDGQSDPIGDVATGISTVKTALGRKPNRLIIGGEVWMELKDHPDLISRFNPTQVPILTPEMIAPILGVEKIIIGEAIQTTSAEEAATDVLANIWGKHASLLYVPSQPDLYTPTWGYTLIYDAVDFLTETWRNGDGATSDAVRVRTAFVMKVLATFAGYYIIDAVA